MHAARIEQRRESHPRSSRAVQMVPSPRTAVANRATATRMWQIVGKKTLQASVMRRVVAGAWLRARLVQPGSTRRSAALDRGHASAASGHRCRSCPIAKVSLPAGLCGDVSLGHEQKSVLGCSGKLASTCTALRTETSLSVPDQGRLTISAQDGGILSGGKSAGIVACQHRSCSQFRWSVWSEMFLIWSLFHSWMLGSCRGAGNVVEQFNISAEALGGARFLLQGEYADEDGLFVT